MEQTVPHPYINTNFKKFIEIPIRGLKWTINKLKIVEIFKNRVKNRRQLKSPYKIESLLMTGLQIPLFREPSRHHFYQHFLVPNTSIHNNAYLADIKNNRFPSTRTLEEAYQLCDPEELQNSLFDLFEGCIQRKLFLKETCIHDFNFCF